MLYGMAQRFCERYMPRVRDALHSVGLARAGGALWLVVVSLHVMESVGLHDLEFVDRCGR